VAMEAVSESVEVPSCSLSFSFWTLVGRPLPGSCFNQTCPAL
jgi:hypothetical protein